jgi:hypothetical protein
VAVVHTAIYHVEPMGIVGPSMLVHVARNLMVIIVAGAIVHSKNYNKGIPYFEIPFVSNL